MNSELISRRKLLQGVGALGLLTAMERLAPLYAQTSLPGGAQQLPSLSGDTINLTIAETPFHVGKRTGVATTINGTVPGPIIRLREGQEVTINVTNRLKQVSSIHWHGILLPPEMDGVPGVSFAGIKPGTTFTYRFPIKQYGTYWYHSHSGGQEQTGVYAPLIFDPMELDPIKYDREYVVVLSDWTFRSVMGMVGDLKKQAGFFNFQQRTMGEFFSDLAEYGWKATWDNYLMWARMRMDPTDFADVNGAVAYTFLMNGLSPEANWTGVFRPGERVRLRFIDAGAMTFFDVRIPGLKMTVVQADGQNVQPVEVDEFRMGPAETYDVIVEPGEGAYTIFAEALDRSGYARGTLAPSAGMMATIPPRRPRPLRTMEDMGMSMEGMDMAGMKLEMDKNAKAGGKMSGMAHGMDMNMPGMKSGDHNMPGMQPEPKQSSPSAKPKQQHDMHKMPDMKETPKQPAPPSQTTQHDMKNMPNMPKPSTQQPAHDMSKMQDKQAMPPGHNMQHDMKNMAGMNDRSEIPGSTPVKHGSDHHGSANQSTPDATRSRLDDPGTGLGGEDRRVLVYTDLKALQPYPDRCQPERELELHATGHMERFIWSFEGKKFSQSPQPIHFRTGERLRWTFVNDTMMEHTFHLHGMFMELENGTGDFLPRKHTVIVKPAERVSVAITADAPGRWAFHCHLLLHMETGMFRIVEVSAKATEARL
ncbi:MAG: copper resistance system multicopper oxidase [Acidobacteria bacterium]|nr:copper resistance system multicopper oxidase [Acidobacteriota bacterium]